MSIIHGLEINTAEKQGRAMKMILPCVFGLAFAACASEPRYAHTERPNVDIERLSNRACPPPGWSRATLETLKASRFDIADVQERQRFATEITACLDSSDPGLRDGIAFEALAHMLRAKQLDDATMRALLVDLTASDPADDVLRPGLEAALKALP